MKYDVPKSYLKRIFDATGSHSASTTREIEYPFGKYVITVRLALNGEFLGVTQIKVNGDFLSHEQRIASTGFHDVERFYVEENEE